MLDPNIIALNFDSLKVDQKVANHSKPIYSENISFDLEEVIAKSTDHLDLAELVAERYGTYWKRVFSPEHDSRYNEIVASVVDLINERAGTEIDSHNFNTGAVRGDMKSRENQILTVFTLGAAAMMVPTESKEMRSNIDWERLLFEVAERAEQVNVPEVVTILGLVAGLPYLATKFWLNNSYMKEHLFNLEIAAKRANERFNGEVYTPTYQEIRGILRREHLSIDQVHFDGINQYSAQLDQGNGYSLFLEANRRALSYDAKCWKAVLDDKMWENVSEVVKFTPLQSLLTYNKMKRKFGQQK